MSETGYRRGKPLDQIVMKAIHDWVAEHDERVIFHGGFVAFDEEGDIIEDRLICYGKKEAIQFSIDNFIEEFDKEEEEFVNW